MGKRWVRHRRQIQELLLNVAVCKGKATHTVESG
jgi:hypothetical protein